MKDDAVVRVTDAAQQVMLNFATADLEMAWQFYRIAIRRHGAERRRAVEFARRAISTVELGLRRLHLTEDESEYFRKSLTQLGAVIKTL
jgi:hypothetical protein